MRRQIFKRHDSAWTEARLFGLLRWQARPRRRCLKGTSPTLHDSLDLWHGELAAGGHGRYLALADWIGHPQQDRRESQRKIAAVEHPLHLLIELEQDQACVDSRSRDADSSGKLCRRVASVQKPAVGARLLDCRQILSLEVLDQDDFLLLDRVQVADDDRDIRETGQSSGSEPPVSGDDYSCRRDKQRLQYALGSDRVCQLLKSCRLQLSARVQRIGVQSRERSGVCCWSG
jgi:hypothetical protein